MMNGAEDTKISILDSIARRLEKIDCDGGAFDRVTREKAETSIKLHDTLQSQFTIFMRGQTAMQSGITTITVLIACLAIMAGGTLVWDVVKAVLHL